ncbi:MAG TPA: transketolase C-terminal domain-containing protein [Gemmatimonadales bacterium]|nr:transketolase C-terminal domain-containing protein [Gemmatimonadales bacterium]
MTAKQSLRGGKAPEAISTTEATSWSRVLRLALISRFLDDTEEQRLVPEKKVLYQFSARGHDVAQLILGRHLTHRHDAVGAYYRSRPLLLSLGLSISDAFAGPMGKSGGMSGGRDIGVVCNLPSDPGPVVLPMSGDVGSQYTPAAGWAQAVLYHRDVLKDAAWKGAIAVVLGGEASVATNGFWSALTMATTLRLPMVFYIEDNGYGISVPSSFQTPGGDIAVNLAGFRHLLIRNGDGVNPEDADRLIGDCISHARAGEGPALVRLTVPRLSGHSGQDTQAYKPAELLAREQASDPLPRLYAFLRAGVLSAEEIADAERGARAEAEAGLAAALALPEPDPATVTLHRMAERSPDGTPILQLRGGMAPSGYRPPPASETPAPEGARINMLTAIRRTLEAELRANPKMLLFGEDVGPKGGVHAATLGLQDSFGTERVFDTSLSEEGIIGRAVGMALAGLLPVPEIQFRKYADPATEQLNNCGTMRWRTNNRWAAPIVVRMPGGYAPKCGDPWHSVCGEVLWAHATGWQVAIPSNAEDAVGLLRSAMRSNNPTIFFEHRALLDGTWARRPYPGDGFTVPFGSARVIVPGDKLTVVTWGAMVERCEAAAAATGYAVEVIDLRTIAPWDRAAVLASVRKTRRCLIVHEDTLTAGFGAEVSAVVAEEAFLSLDAPIQRLAIPDVPTPYNVALMNAILPQVDQIAGRIADLIEF